MPTPDESLIERFYGAFGERDGAAMAACYTPDAQFSDPVFTDLRGAEPGAMWRMLTGRATDLRIELQEHEADDERGSAHWVAHYTFAQTGRPVVNDVHASFRFPGRSDRRAHRPGSTSIAGPGRRSGRGGLLLGWTPLLRSAVRRRARAGLDEFLAEEKAQP